MAALSIVGGLRWRPFPNDECIIYKIVDAEKHDGCCWSGGSGDPVSLPPSPRSSATKVDWEVEEALDSPSTALTESALAELRRRRS